MQIYSYSEDAIDFICKHHIDEMRGKQAIRGKSLVEQANIWGISAPSLCLPLTPMDLEICQLSESSAKIYTPL